MRLRGQRGVIIKRGLASLSHQGTLHMIAFARIGAAQSWPASSIAIPSPRDSQCQPSHRWSSRIMHDYVIGITKIAQLPFELVAAQAGFPLRASK